MQAGDDHVLVVAGVAEQRARRCRRRLATRGTSSCTPPLPSFSFGPTDPSGFSTYRSGRSARAAAEHRVQIEGRGAGVGRQQRVLGDPELRGLIERDVVIDELPDERRPRGHRRVVRVGPVGVRAVGLPLTVGSTISAFGPAAVDRRRPGSRPACPPPTARPAPCRWRRRTAGGGEDPPEVRAAGRRAMPARMPPRCGWGRKRGGLGRGARASSSLPRVRPRSRPDLSGTPVATAVGRVCHRSCCSFVFRSWLVPALLAR